MSNEPRIPRPCPRCGKMRMSTKANRFHGHCQKENAKQPRLAQGAMARLPERGDEEEEE